MSARLSVETSRDATGKVSRGRLFIVGCVVLAVVAGTVGQILVPARGNPALAWLATTIIPALVALLVLLGASNRRFVVAICGLLYLEALLTASVFVIGMAFAILVPIIGIALVQPHVRGRASLGVYLAAGIIATASVALVEFGVPPNPLSRDQPLLTIIAFGLVSTVALGLLWRAGEGQALALDAADRELAARSQAERKVESTAHLLETLIRSSPVATMSFDPSGELSTWNPAAERLFGWTTNDVVGHGLPATLDPPDAEDGIRQRVARSMAGETIHGERVHSHHHDGRDVIVEIHSDARHDESGRSLGVIVQAIDVTERVRLEAELQQAQKLEAVGQLAGGIAHDINNTLTAVGGFAELIERATNDGAIRDDARSITDAVGRARHLTSQLLAFARRSVLQPQVIDAAAFVTSIRPVVQRLVGAAIEVRLDHGIDAATIRVDPGQFEQVLLNLATNARDAMPSGGVLTIGIRRTEALHVVPPNGSENGHDLEPDVNDDPPSQAGWIVLTVADSGSGIAPELTAQVFEPFFTTKARGKGSGLGLAMVYGFVTQSGGEIELHSTLGSGTTVEIRLPEVRDAPVDVPTAGRGLSGATGSETILLIDDEADVLELLRRSLGSLGYDTLTARDGLAAVAIARARTAPIDLILSDVIMPGMSGPEAVAAVRMLHPEAKVLYASGYTADAITDRGVLPPGVELVEKPYTTTQVASRIRSVLDRRRSEPSRSDRSRA